MVGADIKRMLDLLTPEELQVEITVGDLINLLECADSRYNILAFREPLEERKKDFPRVVDLSFESAIVLIRRGRTNRIKRRGWTTDKYVFFKHLTLWTSPALGDLLIDDILHADWEVYRDIPNEN